MPSCYFVETLLYITPEHVIFNFKDSTTIDFSSGWATELRLILVNHCQTEHKAVLLISIHQKSDKIHSMYGHLEYWLTFTIYEHLSDWLISNNLVGYTFLLLFHALNICVFFVFRKWPYRFSKEKLLWTEGNSWRSCIHQKNGLAEMNSSWLKGTSLFST